MGEKSPTPSFEINKNQYTTILRYFLTKFFNNFKWNPSKFTGTSFGKIIVYRTNNQQKKIQYNKILKQRTQ